MNTAALRLDNVGVGPRRGPCLLSGVSFEVHAGQVVALVGANGAGKTSLLRTLAGLTPPREGHVYLGDQEAPRKPAARAAQGLALSFQNPDDQLFGATIEEDVAIGPRHQQLPLTEVHARVASALEATGLTLVRERPVDALSFGEKKLACLAGVLAMQPSVLLLDEPTAGLDPTRERAVLALIRRITREKGVATLVATHAVDELPFLADDVAVLGSQRLLRFSPTNELLADVGTLARAELRPPALVELWATLGALVPGFSDALTGGSSNALPLTARDAALRLAPLLSPPSPRKVVA